MKDYGDYIVISNPGRTKYLSEQICTVDDYVKAHMAVVALIKSYFPNDKIIYTFNAGINTKYSGSFNRAVCDALDGLSVEYYDINGSTVGFELYDNAKLHVGYRVHSHIYCLNRGIPSILLEEEARGVGVNEALGQRHVSVYRNGDDGQYYPSEYILLKLKDELDLYTKDVELMMNCASNKIDFYYTSAMLPYLRKLKL